MKPTPHFLEDALPHKRKGGKISHMCYTHMEGDKLVIDSYIMRVEFKHQGKTKFTDVMVNQNGDLHSWTLGHVQAEFRDDDQWLILNDDATEAV